MTSIKVRFRASTVPGREGHLYIQIIRHRRVRQLTTGCRVYPHEWDQARCRIVYPPQSPERWSYLAYVEQCIAECLDHCRGAVARTEEAEARAAANAFASATMSDTTCQTGQAKGTETDGAAIEKARGKHELQATPARRPGDTSAAPESPKAPVHHPDEATEGGTEQATPPQPAATSFRSSSRAVGLVAYGRRLATMIDNAGRRRTAQTYREALRMFERFHGGKDVDLKMISSALILSFETYLREGRHLCRNTSSFYMRILRAIFNRGVEEGLTWAAQPFAHVYTGVDKTAKRALPLSAVRRVMQADLSCLPHLQRARDVFMFSFFARGMAFVDLCYLRRANLNGGTLTYRRRKTGQLIFVKWEQCMQRIVDRYRREGNDHLLPLMRTPSGSYQEYRNAERSINRHLNRLGELLDLPVKLTMHVARHSWASVARSRHVPISVISEGMGHDSEQTTRIYLSTLDTNAIDRANHDILRAL